MRISPRICVIPACLDFYAQATPYFDFCMFSKSRYGLSILVVFFSPKVYKTLKGISSSSP